MHQATGFRKNAKIRTTKKPPCTRDIFTHLTKFQVSIEVRNVTNHMIEEVDSRLLNETITGTEYRYPFKIVKNQQC
jgi:hypothetical protein